MRRRQRVDLGVYGRALPMLARHPAIFVLPLLAAAVDLLVSALSPMMTDPLGGFGQSIFRFFVQIVYMFAFGVAVIHASDLWRGRKPDFDSVWEEARGKAGGIVLAAIGFQFIIFAAGYLGGFFGFAGQIALALVAYFFLIFTIPAAAIGGLPGSLAISGSIRAVRANVAAALVLAIVFVLLWIGIPQLIVIYSSGLTPLEYALVDALARAILLAYLALPFAAIYDEAAFRNRF